MLLLACAQAVAGISVGVILLLRGRRRFGRILIGTSLALVGIALVGVALVP